MLHKYKDSWKSERLILIIYVRSLGASLVAQIAKNPPAMWDTRVLSLSCEDPLE